MNPKLKVSCCTALLLLLAFLAPLPLEATEESDFLLARGIERLNGGDFSAAAELFEQVLELAPGEAEALYYAGIAYARLGNNQKAELLFRSTLDRGEDGGQAFFELGRLYFLEADCDKAESYFEQYLGLADDASMKTYVRQLIDECGSEDGPRLPLSLAASLGTEYDSNVIIEPTNPPQEGQRADDGRLVLYLAGGLDVVDADRMKLAVDYRLYQSVHFDFEDFNVNYQQVKPELTLTLSDRVSLSAGYSMEYTFFGGESYSLYHSLLGRLRYSQEGGHGTEIGYDYRDNRYWNTSLYPSNDDRDGERHTVGITQTVALGNLQGKGFVFYENETADKGHWSFDGFRVGAEALYPVFENLYLRVGGEYTDRGFDEPFPGPGVSRSENTRVYEAGLTWLIKERLSLTLSEAYTRNKSNIPGFDYRRNIAGIFLTYAFF